MEPGETMLDSTKNLGFFGGPGLMLYPLVNILKTMENHHF
jgi:hypothetical protein